MIFPETADCGHVFHKIPGRSKIVIVLPGLFLIHVCCSGPHIFLTLFDMGGHDGPPKCFWPLCPNDKEEEAETW